MKKIQTLLLTALLLLASACEKFTEPEAFAPAFTLDDATNITRLTATLSGRITSNGGDILEYGFTYGEYENLANATDISFSGTPAGTVETTLSNLDPNTTYYYQLYAGSGVTRVTSEVKSFKTNASDAPSLAGIKELDKNEQSITVSCQLTDDGGYDVIMMGVAYRRSDSQKYSMTILDEPTTEEYTLTVEGLEAGVTYLVCGFAISRGGICYGAETNITTEDSEAPVVNSTEVTSYSGSWAMVSANQLSQGFSAVVERGFCYSTTSTLPTMSDGFVLAEGTANGVFTTMLSELQPATTYYIRSFARNGTKIGYGNVIEVTTKQITAPTLTNVEVTDVTINSFRLTATVGCGNGLIQEMGVCWSTTNTTPDKDSDSHQQAHYHSEHPTDEMALDVTANGLTHNTTYYVRPYAINEAGITYGDVQTVTTPIDPVPGEGDNESPETEI